MNVSLTPELERFVKEQVDAGRYQTASEVVREGLQMLAERQDLIAEINGKIEQAEADVAAGRTVGPNEARAILRAHRETLAGPKSA